MATSAPHLSPVSFSFKAMDPLAPHGHDDRKFTVRVFDLTQYQEADYRTIRARAFNENNYKGATLLEERKAIELDHIANFNFPDIAVDRLLFAVKEEGKESSQTYVSLRRGDVHHKMLHWCSGDVEFYDKELVWDQSKLSYRES